MTKFSSFSFIEEKEKEAMRDLWGKGWWGRRSQGKIGLGEEERSGLGWAVSGGWGHSPAPETLLLVFHRKVLKRETAWFYFTFKGLKSLKICG